MEIGGLRAPLDRESFPCHLLCTKNGTYDRSMLIQRVLKHANIVKIVKLMLYIVVDKSVSKTTNSWSKRTLQILCTKIVNFTVKVR